MRRFKTLLFCSFWMLAVAAGIAVTISEEKAAGTAGKTPSQWPDTPLALDTNRDTLVMFVHPQCPCTRASIEELNRLLAECRGKVTAHVFFFKPDNAATNWTHADLWRSVAAIPGVQLHEDPDNAQANKFGAETSGYVALYNPKGQLQFAGGITAGRGHVGDNAGESSLAALVACQAPQTNRTPVYGCSLTTCSQVTQ